MKNIFKSLCIALSLLVVFCALPLSASAAGTTYYVDSLGGDDSNSGTSQSSAWKTLAKASSLAYGAGDSILLKAGSVFTDTFSAFGSGSSESAVVLGSYGTGSTPLINNAGEQPAISLQDVSFWQIENIEITAPQGTGILIYYHNSVVSDISVKNVVMHNIKNYPSETYFSSSRAALRIMGSGLQNGAHAENILIDGCEIYDCGYGIFTGSNFPNVPDRPYNKNIVVENCSLHDFFDDAFIMADTDKIILRNSSVINACQSSGIYYTAPVWMWGVTNALVENCEIAGAKNMLDGMAIDFDDHTDHSTYQYVYSHDNTMFMWNCPLEADDHYGNTVRYCLSVNDNRGTNGAGRTGTPERDFKFYNNTIINGCTFVFMRYDNLTVQNNIFCLVPGEEIEYDSSRKYNISNNCYQGVLPGKYDKNSLLTLPQFAGNDVSDKNSFVLKKCSPLIGAGVQVEPNMGETDFYGNPLTASHNIGCYDGSGVEGEKERFNIFSVILHIFQGIYRAAKEQAVHDWNWLMRQLGLA